MEWLKKLYAAVLAVFMSIFGWLFPIPEAPESKLTGIDAALKAELVQSETAYLLSLQQQNGALPISLPVYDYTAADRVLPAVDGVAASEYTLWKSATVNPYFASTAAMGLLSVGTSQAFSAVEEYILWHFSHLNTAQTDYCGVDGTIFDYRIFVSPDDASRVIEIDARAYYASSYTEGEVNPYGYDSSDSYAALFLSLLASYCRSSQDDGVVTQRRALVDRVLSAMDATYIEALGLTQAKPDYAACYLMDNCEVYAGYIDAAYLYGSVLGDSSRSEFCLSRAESVKNAIISKMYNSLTGRFYAAVSPSGKAMFSADAEAVKNFYPEGAAQLFPIIFGVVQPDSSVAAGCRSCFLDNHAESWSKLSLGSFPWAVLGRAAVKMGDYDLLDVFLRNLRESVEKTSHAYPYYCAEAGSMLLTLQ